MYIRKHCLQNKNKKDIKLPVKVRIFDTDIVLQVVLDLDLEILLRHYGVDDKSIS